MTMFLILFLSMALKGVVFGYILMLLLSTHAVMSVRLKLGVSERAYYLAHMAVLAVGSCAHFLTESQQPVTTTTAALATIAAVIAGLGLGAEAGLLLYQRIDRMGARSGGDE